jgi:aminoglycoside phosphotransferase (APT) family kinase protein
MSQDPFDAIPADRRDTARAAVASALGSTPVIALRPVTGGASALTYRIETDARRYLLRLETWGSARRNADHYACMRIASDAAIAPQLHHADAQRGVSIMDFLTERPQNEFPGGPAALCREVSGLLRRLQESPAFPARRGSYLDLVGRLLSSVAGSGVFAAGLLEPHREGYERIRQAYPWHDAALVSCHNDPNPRNILFDGERLWLVDWETACRNDPLTDVAIASLELAATPDLQEVLLRSWLGGEPDRATRARFTLMRQVARLYFACLIFGQFAARPEPDSSLQALSGLEFATAIEQGRLRIGTPELLYAWGKMFLAAFRDGLNEAGFEEALVVARRV